MLDKMTFIYFMNEIVEKYSVTEKVWGHFKQLFGNFDGMAASAMGVDLSIKILAKAMNDVDEWIDYFIYECDCGKRYSYVTNNSGIRVPFETVEDLWNVLTTDILQK